MKLASLVALSLISLGAHAQYAVSNSANIQEYNEFAKIPSSVRFTGNNGTVNRIECYAAKGCYAKYKNPENVAQHAPLHGRNAVYSPQPTGNSAMKISFTLRSSNLFSNSSQLDHISLFLRSAATDMGQVTNKIDGMGLAIFKANDQSWDPNLSCVQASDGLLPGCTSGIRLATSAQTAAGSDQFLPLPKMGGSKKDGVAFGSPPQAPAQYMRDNVTYNVTLLATTTGIAAEITAPSLGSTFAYRADRPLNYGDFEWDNTGYLFEVACLPGANDCASQNYTLDISNIAVSWVN